MLSPCRRSKTQTRLYILHAAASTDNLVLLYPWPNSSGLPQLNTHCCPTSMMAGDLPVELWEMVLCYVLEYLEAPGTELLDPSRLGVLVQVSLTWAST